MSSGSSSIRWEGPPLARSEGTGASQAAPRVGTASDVEIVLPGRGLQYPGQLAVLSPAGCVIQTKCRLEPGTMVEVWMRTEGMPLRVAASLVERQESGVQFLFQPMPARKQAQIEALRAELGLG
ncbi:MAG: PilZ domain-containing protein [Acidobacteriaceae bacterium]